MLRWRDICRRCDLSIVRLEVGSHVSVLAPYVISNVCHTFGPTRNDYFYKDQLCFPLSTGTVQGLSSLLARPMNSIGMRLR